MKIAAFFCSHVAIAALAFIIGSSTRNVTHLPDRGSVPSKEALPPPGTSTVRPPILAEMTGDTPPPTTEEQFQSRINNVISGPPTPESDKQLGDICTQLGAAFGFAAFDYIKHLDGRLREIAMSGILAGWATKDPFAAWKWEVADFKKLETDENGRIPSSVAGNFMTMMQKIYSGEKREDLPELLRTTPEGSTRDLLVQFYAQMLAQYDAPKATAYLKDLDPQSRMAATQGIVRELAREAPDAAADWVMTLPEEEARPAIRSALGDWISKDVQGVLQWVRAQKSSSNRDSALNVILQATSKNTLRQNRDLTTLYSSEPARKQALKAVAGRLGD